MVLRRKPEATLTEQLLARAQSADPEVRAAVLLALRELQSPRVREVVRSSLKDPAPAVRLEALRYLSVYRDAESAEPILARLRAATADEADEAELRALAIAFAAIQREKALPELEKVASAELSSRQPAALRASLHGIRACGGAGRASLERLGRSQPRLREEIRGLLGGTA
jgi:HEAT repeat protein